MPRAADALYIATGAGLPKFLNVPGENLPNVFFANEYLTRVNLMKANKFPEYDTFTKRAKNVVVFGGGNVAMDSVRTALRLGAETVTLCYRRTEKEMPARRAEVEHAKAEGVIIHELASPLEFVAGEDGAVKSVKVQNMELGEPDASGRRRPIPIEGSVDELPCDLGVSAIGTNANPIAKLIGPEKPTAATSRPTRTAAPPIPGSGPAVTSSPVPPRSSWPWAQQEGRCQHDQGTAGRVDNSDGQVATGAPPGCDSILGRLLVPGLGRGELPSRRRSLIIRDPPAR